MGAGFEFLEGSFVIPRFPLYEVRYSGVRQYRKNLNRWTVC